MNPSSTLLYVYHITQCIPNLTKPIHWSIVLDLIYSAVKRNPTYYERGYVEGPLAARTTLAHQRTNEKKIEQYEYTSITSSQHVPTGWW